MNKQKNHPQSGNFEGKKENAHIQSITKQNLPVKYVSDVSKLTSYHKRIISHLYAKSHNFYELIQNFERLQFCDVETALQSLRLQKYIGDEDYYYLIERYER